MECCQTTLGIIDFLNMDWEFLMILCARDPGGILGAQNHKEFAAQNQEIIEDNIMMIAFRFAFVKTRHIQKTNKYLFISLKF